MKDGKKGELTVLEEVGSGVGLTTEGNFTALVSIEAMIYSRLVCYSVAAQGNPRLYPTSAGAQVNSSGPIAADKLASARAAAADRLSWAAQGHRSGMQLGPVIPYSQQYSNWSLIVVRAMILRRTCDDCA